MIKHTKEIARSLALKFNKRQDFLEAHDGVYQAVTRNGWADELFAHMESRMEWTDIKKVHKLTKKFKTISAFKEKYGAGYTAIRLKGWSSIVFSHCKEMNHFYTDSELISMAKPFKSRKAFWEAHPNPAQILNKRNLNEKAFAHMKPIGNRKKRYIYIILFKDSAYIGLTYNLDKRLIDHINDSSNKFVKEKINNKESYVYFSDHRLFEYTKAGKMEEYYKIRYKNLGFKILNIKKTGGLGGIEKKWSFDIVQKLIKDKKIKTSWELKIKFGGAWMFLQRNKYLKIIKYSK